MSIKIYTDGACKGNPGDGGWGALIIYPDNEKEIFGYEENTTNNRMELLAAIKALEAVIGKTDVTIYTDSMYLQQGITSWINKWKLNNWKTSSKKDVKNSDLWKRLDDLSDELGRQLDRLKQQADAAERYKTLKAESRKLESLILWYQQQDQKDKQKSILHSKSECQRYLDQLASALSSNERARVKALVAREDANQELEKANTAFYTHAATLSRLETSKE